jgi:hypothetical protein
VQACPGPLSSIKWRPDIAKKTGSHTQLILLNLSSKKKKVTQDAIFRPCRTSCRVIRQWGHCGTLQTVGIHQLKSYMILHSDVLFSLQRLDKTLPKESHLLPFLPPVQALPMPSQQVVIMMDQGPQSSSAALSTPVCILARRTMRRCQLFLQMQHPPQHLPYPQTVLPHPPTVKDPGDQYISATPPIPLLLLQGHPPPPTRHLSVFQRVQVFSSPFPLAVKDLGTQSTFSAALSILLLLQRVLLAPRVMRHQHRFLLDLPLPQRPPVAPRMCNVIESFKVLRRASL